MEGRAVAGPRRQRKHRIDGGVAMPLDPETPPRGLIKVDPDSALTRSASERCPKTSMGRRCLLRAGHFGPCRFPPA